MSQHECVDCHVVWDDEDEARASGRAQPEPCHDPDCSSRSRHGPPFDLCDCRLSRPSQERPPIDVERARQAFEIHDMEHHGIGGLHPESCDEWIATEYLRLSGSVGEP